MNMGFGKLHRVGLEVAVASERALWIDDYTNHHSEEKTVDDPGTLEEIEKIDSLIARIDKELSAQRNELA